MINLSVLFSLSIPELICRSRHHYVDELRVSIGTHLHQVTKGLEKTPIRSMHTLKDLGGRTEG